MKNNLLETQESVQFIHQRVDSNDSYEQQRRGTSSNRTSFNAAEVKIESQTKIIQQILTQQKDNVNQDLVEFLKQLQEMKGKSKVVQNLIVFIRDFLLIPSQAFTIKSLTNCLKQIESMIKFTFNIQNPLDKQYILIVLNLLTNLSSILTGAVQRSFAVSEKDFKIQSVLKYPYAEEDTQLIFNYLLQYLPPQYCKQYFSKHPGHKQYMYPEEKKSFFAKKVTIFPKFEESKFLECKEVQNDLQNNNTLITKQLNKQIENLMNTIDEIDSDIRAQLNMNPPKFPSNVSPIERKIQYQIDVLELQSEEIRVENANEQKSYNEYLNQIRSKLQESSNYSDNSTDQEVSFQSENPYAYDVKEEDYVFSETRNNFYSNDNTFLRPLFLYALASSTGYKSSQRALFTLMIEGQFLCMLSVLLEEIAKNHALTDVPNFFEAAKFLSELINRSNYYTYGETGNITKLHYLQQNNTKLSDVNTQLLGFNKQFFTDKSVQSKFVVYYRAFTNTQVIIFNQLINMHFYQQYDKKTQKLNQEKQNQQQNQDFFMQTKDFYISSPLYKQIPCDSIQIPMRFSNMHPDPIFQDVYNQQINRFYLHDNSFNIACEILKLLCIKIKSTCDNSSRLTQPIYKQDNELLCLLMDQFKSVKVTSYFQRSMDVIQSESLQFNALLNHYHKCVEQQQQQRLSVNQESQQTSEDIEKSGNRTSRMKRQPEGSTKLFQLSSANSEYANKLTNNSQDEMNMFKQMTLQDFIPLKRINSGGYGTVVLVSHKTLKKPLAIKIIRKEDMIRKNSVSRIKLEAQIYKIIEQAQLNSQLKMIKAKFSDFVVRFYGSFKTQSHLFIVLDFCSQGDLANMLKICGSFGEQWSQRLIAEIIVGLSILHACGIVYNDMKPENMLMSDDGHIKFTDFGISKIAVKCQLEQQKNQSRMKNAHTNQDKSEVSHEQVSVHNSTNNLFQMDHSINEQKSFIQFSAQKQNIEEVQTAQMEAPNSLFEKLNNQLSQYKQLNIDQQDNLKQESGAVGTPFYMAPEILQGFPPSNKTDFWAVGITLYEFLYGNKPFEDYSDNPSPDNIFQKILTEEVQFPDDDSVSEAAQEIIKLFLQKDPTQRLSSFRQIKNHPFFSNLNWETIFKDQPVVVPQKQQLPETPLYQENENWVANILNEQEKSIDTSVKNSLDDQWKDFSYTNQNLLAETRIKKQLNSMQVSSNESVTEEGL